MEWWAGTVLYQQGRFWVLRVLDRLMIYSVITVIALASLLATLKVFM